MEMALVRLTPRPKYRAMREQHKKYYVRSESGMTKKEKAEWGITTDWDTNFDALFTPTEFLGVYMSRCDEGAINCWCKQYAYYGGKFYKQLRKFENIRERMNYQRNCWTYGVTDNLQQIVDFYNTNEEGYFKGNHVVLCFEVHKDPDAPCCGWRWHKWGEYIGTQNPRCEYLNDEPEIEKVICFSIYKVR